MCSVYRPQPIYFNRTFSHKAGLGTLLPSSGKGHETKKEEKGLIVNGRVMTSSTQKKRLHTQGASADTRQPASSNTKRSVFVIKALAFDLKPRAAEQAKGRAFLVNFQVPRERKDFQLLQDYKVPHRLREGSALHYHIKTCSEFLANTYEVTYWTLAFRGQNEEVLQSILLLRGDISSHLIIGFRLPSVQYHHHGTSLLHLKYVCVSRYSKIVVLCCKVLHILLTMSTILSTCGNLKKVHCSFSIKMQRELKTQSNPSI